MNFVWLIFLNKLISLLLHRTFYKGWNCNRKSRGIYDPYFQEIFSHDMDNNQHILVMSYF